MDRLGKDTVAVKDDAWVSDSDLCGRVNDGALCQVRDIGRGPWLALWGAGRRGERISF